MSVIKKILLISVPVIVSFMLVAYYYNSNFNNKNLFNDVVKAANGEVVEYGITTSFYDSNFSKDNMEKFLKKIGLYNEVTTKTIENDKICCLEFKNDNIKGYIQSTNEEGKRFVTINIIESKKNGDINQLEERLKKALSNDSRYFIYMKAKLPDDNLQYYNSKIMHNLKSRGAVNIDCISVNNGYSITASMNSSDYRAKNKSNNFNCALCKYTSGSYVLIGIPEILELY